MPYAHRTSGKRWKHDPSSRGIFIHGGTCLQHHSGAPFKHDARPNRFGLTFPTVADSKAGWPPEVTEADHRKVHPTFQRALAAAREIRDRTPAYRGFPIYACTDLIMENPYAGRIQVQFVA